MEDAKSAFDYVCGGRGKFTMVSTKTGKRFTYRAKQYTDNEKKRTPVFISVLNGSDNTSDYRYIGFIVKSNVGLNAGKKGLPMADSYRALDWALKHMANGNMPEGLEFYHSGSCGKCGRELTVPESIVRGMGPVCAGKV